VSYAAAEPGSRADQCRQGAARARGAGGTVPDLARLRDRDASSIPDAPAPLAAARPRP